MNLPTSTYTFITWLDLKLLSVETLIRNGIRVGVIFIIGATWWKTKALVPTVISMAVGGTVLWAAGNTHWFENKVGEETVLVSFEPAPVALDAPVVVDVAAR